MNKTVVIILIVIVSIALVAGLSYLFLNGFLEDVSWEGITIVVAAGLGPAQMLLEKTKSEVSTWGIAAPSNAQRLKQLEEENQRQAALRAELEANKTIVKTLESDLQLMSANIELLEAKKVQLSKINS